MFYLRMAAAIAGFVAASLYGIAIALLRSDRSRVARDYAQMLARLMRPPLGIRSEVLGREHMTAPQPCIYIVNHQSMYDVPLLAELFPPDTVIIGKQELRRIPFFGWLYAATGNILIDRKDSPGAVGRLREAAEAIVKRGVSVWIFPEGTRSRVPGRLLPLKKGAFQMAVAAAAPLIPIVVEPLAPFFDASRRHLRPGTIRIRVLPPIDTAGLAEADVPDLLSRTQERMQAALSALAEQRTQGMTRT